MKNTINANKFWARIMSIAIAAFILIIVASLSSCTHTIKHKSESNSKIDSTSVKHEGNIDIRNHVEDSANANKKSIENNTDSSTTKTVTVVLDKDTSGKDTEISIDIDSTGKVNVTSNKRVKSVNASQKQANKKQEKQVDANASTSKKADLTIKASDKNDSTNKKADIKITTKDVDTKGVDWGFLWWLIPVAVVGVGYYLYKKGFKI